MGSSRALHLERKDSHATALTSEGPVSLAFEFDQMRNAFGGRRS